MPAMPCSRPALLALGLCLAAGLAGCAESAPPLMNSPRTDPAKAPVTVARPVPVPTPPPTDPAVAPPARTSDADDEMPSVIYYAPDVYTVKEEYRPLLQAHAKRLIADPKLKLRIDAHTDDSGPADYNLELARMRAQVVMKQLIALGVPASQLQVVRHGKGGRPAAKGGGAPTQAENRRVELSYR
jgi:peptidoglycan-associated lipoprotein